MPDRRGPKQAEELAELRGEIQPDYGRISKKWRDAETEDKSLAYVF
jgi:hypothetical protein